MKRILQRINFLANIGILFCSIASFFFISYNVTHKEMDIISLITSTIFLIFGIAIFIHGVILPDREVRLGEKASRILRILILIAILFAEDKIEYANSYMDLSADKVYRRSWNPGTMFVILVLGSFVFFLALLVNKNFYYRLCLLGAGILILVLFVLSFIYEYYDSKENQNGRFKRTVIGILAAFLVLCVLGYVAFTKARNYYEPFENYDKVEKQLKQWEDFKEKHPELYNNESSKN